MIYVVGWLMAYAAFFLWFKTKSKLPIAITLCVLGGIAVVRNSGTDTEYVYETIAERIISGDINGEEAISGIEPGFKLFVYACGKLFGSEVIAVRCIAVLFTILTLTYLFIADDLETYFLIAFFVPVCFYSYSMNVVRIGIAMAFFAIAWQAARRGNLRAFAILSILALSFHYSVVVAIAIVSASLLNISNVRGLLILAAATGVIAMPILLNAEYFGEKFNLYSDFESPSALSGLTKSGPIFIICGSLLLTQISHWAKIQYAFIFLTATVSMQLLSSMSYAGIRVLDIILTVAPMASILLIDKSEKPIPRQFRAVLLILGVLLAAGVYRNFLTDYDGSLTGSSTPFLPYRTILPEF